MPKFDTLSAGGQEKKLADWPVALEGSSADFMNLRADVLRLLFPGGAISDPELFAFESQIIFRTQRDSTTGNPNSFSGGTVEFQGKRVGEVKEIRGDYNGVQYEFHGPWYDLENTVYQQPIGSWQTGDLTFPFQSELLLFSRLNTTTGVLSRITNGDQIRDVLQFIIDGYSDPANAPFQIGIIDPALNLPYLPCKPMRCSDATEKCLELSPDCVVAFDYTFTPPKVHVRSIANLVAMTLAIANGIDHTQLRIVPRPDLKPNAMIVIFRITTTIDGNNYISQVIDKYGPHGANSLLDPDRGLRVVVDWIDLLGVSRSDVEQSIVTTPVPATTSDSDLRDFWSKHDKQFEDLRVRMQDSLGSATHFPALTVTDADTGDPVSLVDYPMELVDGNIAPWMGFNVKRVKVSSVLTYAVYDGVGSSETDTNPARGKLIRRFSKKEHHVEITVTNGTTGTYDTTGSVTTAETVPTGMAQGIWNSLNRLQHEGECLKVQAAINGGISMLNTLNLSGGRAEWLTMAAQIQGIHKDYGSGETSITIGPAKHLNADQLMSIFRAFRYRLVFTNPNLRATGNSGSGGSGGTEIAKNAPKKNTMEGLENPSAQVLAYYNGDDPTSTLKGKTNIDAKDIDSILTATTPTPVTPFGSSDIKEVKHREVQCCLADGTSISMIVLSGAPYTKP
jgi:hypothetical protein